MEDLDGLHLFRRYANSFIKIRSEFQKFRLEYMSSDGIIMGAEAEDIKKVFDLVFAHVFEQEIPNVYEHLRDSPLRPGNRTRESDIGVISETLSGEYSSSWTGNLGDDLPFTIYEHKYAGSKLILFVDEQEPILEIFENDIDTHADRESIIFQAASTHLVIDQLLEWVGNIRKVAKIFNNGPYSRRGLLNGTRSWDRWLLDEGSVL